MFLTPVDIANRALQHCGATRIDATAGFTENSKNASECGFCYDKLRQAELRRNVWRFAIKRAVLRAIDATTMLLVPALWASATSYFVGSIVADETGQIWVSASPNNLNNQPGNSQTWVQYYGPLTVSLYSSTQTYFAGELVYTTAGDGTNRVFVSLVTGNADDPSVATDWSATATYMKNQVVTETAIAYMSLIDLNINQQPSLAPAQWDVLVSYSIGQQVGATDGVIYTSLTNANLGNPPPLDVGINWITAGVLDPWTTDFVGGVGSLQWLQVGGAEFPFGVTLSPTNIIYPIGSGPSTQENIRNVFRLPSGFLRKAPRDPKAGSTSSLGAPTNLAYDDWLFEGDYIVSTDTNPIILRFIADTVDVPRFDAMFCEGLAARIGLEVCEPLTQSSDKLKTIDALYTRAIKEARTVNGIETGAEEAPLDDYLACRY